MPRSDLKRAPGASHRGAGTDGHHRVAPPDDAQEPPPILGSWAALYAIVIAGLALMIALCWAITRWAA